jgi:hypothetical protein
MKQNTQNNTDITIRIHNLHNKQKRTKHTTIHTMKKVKVKVNFTVAQATKVQKGSRGIVLLFP